MSDPITISGGGATLTVPPQGPQGPRGAPGPSGMQGEAGPVGADGPAGPAGPLPLQTLAAWATGQVYTATAPASFVAQAGSSYACAISHTSGTFAADLAAGKWIVVAAKGTPGAGTGDMLGANNLSDVASAATSLANLGGVPTARTITAAGLATGGGNLSANLTITVPKASAADIIAGTDDVKAITSKGLSDAGVGGGSGFSTGDAKITLKTAADAGWVMANDGTIGDASSGASTRANSDTAALYAILWAIPDAYAPVTGGRGANAAADFAAHKKIALTKALGRAIAIAGTGSGLSARPLGSVVGEEEHTLTTAELPNITLPCGDGTAGEGGSYSGLKTGSSNTPTINTTANGGGSHNNMQPTSFWNIMIKL
jgi:hypothetical protein